MGAEREAGPPSLLSPVSLASGSVRAREVGPVMSVYVGIDVHRKRSQVAVIAAGGEVLANRNVSNGVEPILGVIGGLPTGMPAAFEAAFGWGWLAGAAGGLRVRPAPGAPAAVQGDCLGAAEERQDGCGDLGAAAARRSAAAAVDRPRQGCASCGRCCGTGSFWCGFGRCCATGSTRCWLTMVMTGRPAAGAARAAPGSLRCRCHRCPARWSAMTWR
jgi:hypothetical protein